MNRPSLPLILLSLLLALSLQSVARAQDSTGDYALIHTHDVGQAVDFMRDVMGCEPIEGASIDGPRALLECGHGSVVEIVHGTRPSGATAPLSLRADNLPNVLASLRRQQIRIIRDPATQGRRIIVDVVSPWGQTLELVGRPTTTAPPPSARLASD